MIEIISAGETGRRREKLERIGGRGGADDAEVTKAVTSIIDDVRRRGDTALLDYTALYDGVRMRPEQLRVRDEELREYASRVEPEVLAALRVSARNVRAFHERERAYSWEMDGGRGVRVGQRITPVDAAGLYVPGGTASYPSSVVMNVVPAHAAGVGRVVVVTPPHTLEENPSIAAALVELGVTEVYRVGGAQAVAALAYGTETVKRVDVVTGPGNKYVAAAKRLVYGAVGIDSVAGPSEVLILADETARADFVAADLIAQAEHDEDSCAMLVTTSEKLAREVAEEVERASASLPRLEKIIKALSNYGAVFVVDELEEGIELANELAPEHLQIITRDDEGVASRIRNAGAIFLGAHTPEAVGDYIAGPNHVLPTGGSARFSSALGVSVFTRRTSIVRYTREELNETAPLIAALARNEGLEAHARSALIRLEGYEAERKDVASA